MPHVAVSSLTSPNNCFILSDALRKGRIELCNAVLGNVVCLLNLAHFGFTNVLRGFPLREKILFQGIETFLVKTESVRCVLEGLFERLVEFVHRLLPFSLAHGRSRRGSAAPTGRDVPGWGA